jgi:hypothetical protein
MLRHRARDEKRTNTKKILKKEGNQRTRTVSGSGKGGREGTFGNCLISITRRGESQPPPAVQKLLLLIQKLVTFFIRSFLFSLSCKETKVKVNNASYIFNLGNWGSRFYIFFCLLYIGVTHCTGSSLCIVRGTRCWSPLWSPAETHIVNRNLYRKYRLKTRVGRSGLINNRRRRRRRRRRRDSKRGSIFRQADTVTNELRYAPMR